MDQINKRGQKSPASWRSPLDVACTALAVVLGLAIGWLDLHVTEIVVTILALLAVGLLLGSLQPAAAWRWAPLMAIGLPIMATAAPLIGLQTAEPAQPDLRIVLVALGFAFLGTYIGVLVRHTVRTLTTR